MAAQHSLGETAGELGDALEVALLAAIGQALLLLLALMALLLLTLNFQLA